MLPPDRNVAAVRRMRLIWTLLLHGFALWGFMDALDRLFGLGWRI